MAFQVTRMPIRRLFLALLLFAAPSIAFAQEGRVIGDSLGVGVDWAAKLPSTAKNSVAIYSGAILEQLRQAHKGETVFMSLGTNDAVGGEKSNRRRNASDSGAPVSRSMPASSHSTEIGPA